MVETSHARGVLPRRQLEGVWCGCAVGLLLALAYGRAVLADPGVTHRGGMPGVVLLLVTGSTTLAGGSVKVYWRRRS